MMGNGQSGGGDLANGAIGNYQPLGFSKIHSENIRISANQREAKRFESFCKGICFSNRPIVVGERIYIVFTEISSSWSGALRFGFTSHDPLTLNASQLPRYACPDLTSKAGYWAKSLGERFAEVNNKLCFHLINTGDVLYSLNGEDKGIFLSGVNLSSPLWVLLDIYGNTVGIKFDDGHQPLLRRATADANMEPSRTRGLPQLPTETPVSPGVVASPPSITINHYKEVHFKPIKLHSVTGKNVLLSPDRTFTSRIGDEYCNAYVFLERPLKTGEKVCIQICQVDRSYVGGLAFGLTSHDPRLLCPNADFNQNSVIANSLPDDADHLLDRPEYWVVNKDVAPMAEIGDELGFAISSEGQVNFEKNGKFVATLMYVDKTLPLWPLFDLYGHTTSIKVLGVASLAAPTPNRSMSLDRTFDENALNSLASKNTDVRMLPPPPPATGSQKAGKRSNPPPRPLPPTIPDNSPPANLPPPLVPQAKPSRPAPKPKPVLGVPQLVQPNAAAAAAQHPNPPPSSAASLPAPDQSSMMGGNVKLEPTPSSMSTADSNSASENTSECVVCLEAPVDCALYKCGHMCMCYSCAMDLKTTATQDKNKALCPMCRKEIDDILRVFKS